MRHRSSTRALRLRGAASIEAALLLPVFAIVLCALFFIGRLYLARAETRAAARRCAFVHAARGCAEPPPSCGQVLDADRGERAPSEAAALRARTSRHDRFGVLSRVPLLGEAIDGLSGTAFHARVERSVARPWGAAPAEVTGTAAVLCNERPRNVATAVRRVFCDALPVLKCEEGA
jgi:hypothetical protein